MKNPLPLLISAVTLAALFTGCGSVPGGASYTLETGQVRDLLPPDPTENPVTSLVSNLASTEAVADLDKRDVLQRFGRPAERLNDDVWIYWGYQSPEDAAQNGGHDTLVVTFARGHVSAMRLVPAEALRAQLAGAWPPRPAIAQR